MELLDQVECTDSLVSSLNALFGSPADAHRFTIASFSVEFLNRFDQKRRLIRAAFHLPIHLRRKASLSSHHCFPNSKPTNPPPDHIFRG